MSEIKVDTVAEKTSANGVTVDGLNIKDSKLVTANSVVTSNVTDGNITTAKILDDNVTYAKIQNVSATDRILGRDSSGAGVIEEITPANLRTMLNVADGANVGGGKLLQVQNQHFTSHVTTTATSFADTGITKAITPSATSSKILITLAIKLSTHNQSNERIMTQILRGSTVVALNERTLLSNNSDTQAMVGYQFLDSPNTTNATTYKIQWRGINGETIKLNDYEGTSSFSSLTLMEIGA